MPNNKLERSNQDIQRELSVLLREIKDPRVRQGMISITATETTPDLKFCKVYLSVLGLQDERGMLKGLSSAAGFLRRELGRALNLRHTPELSFVIDKSMEHGARMTQILKDLAPKTEETEEDVDEVE